MIEYALAINTRAITTLISLVVSMLSMEITIATSVAMAKQPKLIRNVFKILFISCFFILASVLFGQLVLYTSHCDSQWFFG